ncbi:MAG: hypothetical protein H8D78_05225, partial [Chloroflexi bacterium]|nr:hypothetical protein [Chloroflexota bacterium]
MRFKHLLALFSLGLTLVWTLGSHTPAITAAPAAELRVCPAGPPACDYTSLQEAVDAAHDGDVIKVATGTYTDVHQRGGLTQVVYVSKTVTIGGGYTTTNWHTPDPQANPTTLDAQGQGRVVYITGDVAPTLEGLRITGGDASGLGGGPWGGDDAAGGVYVATAAATLNNCRVFDNTAQSGGGLYLQDSDATLRGNVITTNSAVCNASGSYGDGGGLFLNHSAATLSENVI